MRIGLVVLLFSSLLLQQAPSVPTSFYCPMHPDEVADKPGNCHICGMKLIPGNPLDAIEFKFEAETVPRAVKAGTPFDVRLKVVNPKTGRLAKDFELTHDKKLHLFVVSQDLKHFQHIHPEQNPDGSFFIKVTVPDPGYYKLFSEFVPKGGTMQVMVKPLITAGYDGGIDSMPAKLQPDVNRIKTADGMRVVMENDPPVMVAGERATLKYDLSDAATGRDVTDLEPYLGAWGHMFVLHEDTTDSVHSHPSELIPPDADLKVVHGGPHVTFECLFPRPGNYRVWTQFMRGGKLTTVFFTVSVKRS